MSSGPQRPHRWRWIRPISLFLLCLILSVGLLALLLVDARCHMTLARGIESGLAEEQPPLVAPRLGTNVALEQYADDDALLTALETVNALSFGTVRQRFSWAELEPLPGAYRWQEWDRILPLVHAYGLDVIAVLDTSPDWARAEVDADNPWAPPASFDDYARFVHAFAARYGRYITAYQVWDEPNIAPHWGARPADPAGYVQLLQLAAEAIRSADPDAVIIAGGLAPNLEPGGMNKSDVAYLSEMYRLGAAGSFDVLGAKAYGFWSGPEDRRVSPEVLNYSRLILLRREMVRHGDAHKSIWALESGWCALPEGWAGRPSPHGSDEAFIQAERLTRAIRRTRQEWPWLGLQCVLHLQPRAANDDPIWGYALIGPDGEPRPGFAILHEAIDYESILYPGLTHDVGGYLTSQVDTHVADLHYWGTDLSLHVAKGPAGGRLIIGIDEDPGQDVVIDLYSAEPTVERVRLTRGLPVGIYRVRVQALDAGIGAVRGIQVGYHPIHAGFWLEMCAGLLVLTQLGVVMVHTGRRIPWRSVWTVPAGLWRRLPQAVQGAWMVGTLLALALAPAAWARLGAAALYGLGALFRPDLALLMAVGVIPLAPLHARLGPGSFSLAEITLLTATGARIWDALVMPRAHQDDVAERPPLWRRLVHLRPEPEDVAMAGLVVVGVVATLAAHYRHVALREARLMIIEPAILYVLICTWPDRRQLPRLAEILWLAGVGVALFALAVYPLADGVIEAEGVRRARAFYGSPNNLALVMGRTLPLGLAMALWGGAWLRPWARRLYVAGSVAVAAALLLTYSRGAWLLGLPAILLTLTWVWKRRALLGVAALVVVGIAGLFLLGNAERFTSLLDPSRGTTFLRISLWEASWDMALQHPWLGVGPDNFLYHYGSYIRPGAEVDPWLSHPHNLVLDFWLRLGIGGLMVLALIGASLARHAVVALRRPPRCRTDALYLGLVVALIGAVAHGLVDSFYFVTELALWTAFVLAWLVTPRAPVKAPEAGQTSL